MSNIVKDKANNIIGGLFEKNKYLNDQANALRVQKHQISTSENKLTEIDNILNMLENEQKNNSES